MCDTLVAVGTATADGTTVFGKNSDRPHNEVQNLIYLPRQEHKEAVLKSTYIKIPQVQETYGLLLCQPYWMWGGEMGANEYGVVIGNEAVYSKEPDGPPALLGMDLLRLGLERARTAKDALQVIASLLEEFGQGGGCAADDPSWTYHNSFLIADAKEAWVLETAGKWWIGERVTNGIRNISNGLSIRTKFDITSEGLIDYAKEKGYWNSSEPFDFAQAFSWNNVSNTPSPFSREGRARFLLESNIGQIDPKLMIANLRDHDAGICMHGGFRSTASMVSRIVSDSELTLHWFTATPQPCKSFFKPLFMTSNLQLPSQLNAEIRQNPNTLWWAHELAIKKNEKQMIQSLHQLETKYYSEAQALIRYPERKSRLKNLFFAAFNEEWNFYQDMLKTK